METKLSINDIVQIRNIIDVCSRRGAFQAGEMELVGGLYNKIKALTDEVEAQIKKQQEEKAQEEEKSNELEPVPEDPNESSTNVDESSTESTENNVSMNVSEN